MTEPYLYKAAAGPSKAAWAAVAVIIMGGVMATAAMMIYTLFSARTDIARFKAPGDADITLSTSGHFVVFHEYSRADDGFGFKKPKGVQKLVLQIKPGGGAPLELHPVERPEFYTYRRFYAESIFDFVAPAAGKYHVSAIYPNPGDGEPLTLVIRQSGRRVIFRALGQGIAVIGSSAILIVLILWRSRHAMRRA